MNLMPAAYALSLVEYARQQQIDLLKATGISEAELHSVRNRSRERNGVDI